MTASVAHPNPPAKNKGGRPKRVRTDPGMLALLQRAGTFTKLAKRLGVSVGAVSQWEMVPEKDVARLCAVYPSLSPHMLRPDLFDASNARIHA